MRCPKCQHVFEPESLELLAPDGLGAEKQRKLLDLGREFMTGLPVIDEQHLAIVGMVNRLHGFQRRGAQPQGAIPAAVAELEDYVTRHFAAEEALFTNSAYPEKNLHIQQHASFAREVRSLRDELANSIVPPYYLVGLVLGWFKSHIQGFDLKYVPYVSAGTGKRG
jgi:hemerythrin-like metal-binding protein